MTTSATIGTGAGVAFETAAGSDSYTDIVGIFNITPPATSVDSIDGTEMESGRDREFVPGLRTPGEIEVSMHFVAGSATDDAIEAWIAAAEARSVRLTYGNNETVTASGFPTNYATEIPMDDKQAATLTITLSGAKTRS